MPFDYDLERIIDDFILLSVFVGNDFLPHLPNLHINEGAMEEIWNIYKRVLPVAGESKSTLGANYHMLMLLCFQVDI
jgi:5'-3' exoribonuclease 1